MLISKPVLETYLRDRLGSDVRVRSFGRLGEAPSAGVLKGFGYGYPLFIDLLHKGRKKRVVLETMRPGPHGHEHMADRAHAMLWDYGTYNRLPHHVHALDVGAFTARGRLQSVGEAREFFVLTEYAAGREYQRDLARIARTGSLERQDVARARVLADYLVGIHRVKKKSPSLYRRALRDLIGHGECLMGVIDSYPSAFAFITPALLESIEDRANAWRWKLRNNSGRLSQVHGDYHPWNILFRKGTDFSVLDRARAEWGEPADDVVALTINYLFFSVRRWGDLRGPFERLFILFWERYLERTGDEQILKAVAPFFAFRGLVIASPVWYPALSLKVRRTLFTFIDGVLDQQQFDPARVNDLLK